MFYQCFAAQREGERERRACFGGGDLDLAGVAVDDRRPRHGQPLTGPPPEGLGREERLEYAGQDVGGMPGPVSLTVMATRSASAHVFTLICPRCARPVPWTRPRRRRR